MHAMLCHAMQDMLGCSINNTNYNKIIRRTKKSERQNKENKYQLGDMLYLFKFIPFNLSCHEICSVIGGIGDVELEDIMPSLLCPCCWCCCL
jgi:uncharacterized protein YeeX (DUF496 family)